MQVKYIHEQVGKLSCQESKFIFVEYLFIY